MRRSIGRSVSAEIDKEIAKKKFTLAELDEEEQSLERLRRWHRELRLRDALGAPSATDGAPDRRRRLRARRRSRRGPLSS
jgi:hypothetical protein